MLVGVPGAADTASGCGFESHPRQWLGSQLNRARQGYVHLHTLKLAGHLAGWSSWIARRAHNSKVGGSSPPPATVGPGARALGLREKSCRWDHAARTGTRRTLRAAPGVVKTTATSRISMS